MKEIKFIVNRKLTNEELEYLTSRQITVVENYENSSLSLTTHSEKLDTNDIQSIFEDAVGSKKEYNATVVKKIKEKDDTLGKEESKLQKASKGKFVITSKNQPGELFIGHSIGGKQIQWVEEWRKPITFSSESEANKFLREIEMDGMVINKEESKLQKAAKPKESKLSKALKTVKVKTIEGYVKAEEKVKEAIAEKKSEMEKYIKINDLKKFAILEFTKNGKMFKLDKAVRGFNIEDRPGNKSKVIIYHYTPELEEFLVSNKIKATVFDSKEELNEWLTSKL